MSSNRLQAIDINLESFVHGKGLHMPVPQQSFGGGKSGPPRSRQLFTSPADKTSNLSYKEVQKSLQSTLSRVEILCSGNPEECRLILQNELSRLLLASSEETREMLSAALDDDDDTPLSFRVLEVLHFRRRELCKGYEYNLNDLKEWLSLALLLEEPNVLQFMMQYTDLLGPHSRESIEKVFLVPHSSSQSLCQEVLKLSAPGDKLACFDTRYYSLMLDDLIAMGDETPQCLPVQSVQTEVTSQMRELHAEWLLQVSVALNLNMETFFLSLAIVDSYLCKITMKRDRLHLLGCAALLLASKQEEIFSPSLRSLVRYGADHFTADMLVATECHIFAVLSFDVVMPTLSAVCMGLLMQQDPPPSEAQCSYVMYILATLAIRTHCREHKVTSLAATALYMSRVCFNISRERPCEEVLKLLPYVKAALYRNLAVGTSGVYDIFSRPAYHEVSKLKIPDLAE